MEEWFHTFPLTEADGFGALSFNTYEEAVRFYDVLMTELQKCQEQANASNSSFSSTKSSYNESNSSSSFHNSSENLSQGAATKDTEVEKKKEKKKTKLIEKLSKLKLHRKPTTPKVAEISGPTNFKHISCVGYSSAGTSIEVTILTPILS
jgi:hypothetical protein